MLNCVMLQICVGLTLLLIAQLSVHTPQIVTAEGDTISINIFYKISFILKVRVLNLTVQ